MELIMIDWRIDVRSGAAPGLRALRNLKQVRVDLALLGICAIDAGAGLAASNVEETELKWAEAEATASIATALTSEKLEAVAPFGVMAASYLTHLVVEAEMLDAAPAPLPALGVQVRRAAPLEARL